MSVLRCNTSFHPAGSPVMVRAGSLWRSDDPIVKGREHLFTDVDRLVEGDVVEAATANPGKRRSVPVRKKAPAVKPTAED